MADSPQPHSLAIWLAYRAVRTSPAHTLVRVLVGTLAVMVVLLALALHPTAHNRSERAARIVLPVQPRALASSGVLASESSDYFDGTPITIRSFARVNDAGESSSLGVALPQQGHALVSPGLAAAIRLHPELARRFPEPIDGTLPNSVLMGPQALVIWRGVGASEMPANAGWLAARSFKRTDDIAAAIPTEVAYAVPMLVIGFAVPLVALMALLSTFGLARREHRLAALRLLGLSDRAARTSAAFESGLAAVISSILGLAAFFALVGPTASHSPIAGAVWPHDVALAPWHAGLALASVPVLAVSASWLSLRSLSVGALSIERRSRRVNPRKLPAVLVLVGAAAATGVQLGFFGGSDVQARVVIAGTVVAIVGVLWSLPWVLRILVKIVVATARDLPSLIAARRVQAAPDRCGRVATGLAVLVVVSGPLLVFFPLIADLGAQDLGELSSRVGSDTILTQNGAGEVSDARWDRALRAADVKASLAVWTVQIAAAARPKAGGLIPVTVLVADCDDLQTVLHVSSAQCDRGLRTFGSAQVPTDRATLVREKVHERRGTLSYQPVGEPFSTPTHPVESNQLAALVDGLSTAATLLIPKSLVDPAFLNDYPRAQFIQVAAASRLESVRTAIVRATSAEALTLGERQAIARRTTEEFETVAHTAAFLIALIAAAATAITVADIATETGRETKLLHISGVPRRLTSRSLLLQVLLPTLAMVLPAAALSLLFATAFAGLLDFADIPIPFKNVAIVALCALSGPVVATVVTQRLLRPTSLIAVGD